MSFLRSRIYRFWSSKHNEAQCRYVGSRGLLKSCDFHNRNPVSTSGNIDRSFLKSFREGESIYVCTNALEAFVTQHLPNLKKRFTLVTGDSILTVNREILPKHQLRKLIESPFLENWFAQNLAMRHEKIYAIPLGLDYHTLTLRARHPWGRFQTPVDQERSLVSVRGSAPRLEDKSVLAYCNWQHSIKNGKRTEVVNSLDKTAVHFEKHRLARFESWTRNSRYLFTLSPFGAGMDCHRTWEAILLGSVPIVQSSPLNSLFKRLPVSIVEDWRQVTPRFLEKEKDRILTETYDFSPLYLETWQRRFRGIPDYPREPVSYEVFLSGNRVREDLAFGAQGSPLNTSWAQKETRN
ncbi:hypothetical protein [Flexibacterium corallicola]|uniref:hypothetical protein n=1 Tax=Flexibacterium corallicola TaxID=3037259 RepID=UPI00286EFB51|nr:hypothetical protein [Pseudovibrio sp. M1P-2-3]